MWKDLGKKAALIFRKSQTALDSNVFHDLGRRSDHDSIVGNILRDDRCGTYDGILPHRHSRKDGGTGTDPAVSLQVDRFTYQD